MRILESVADIGFVTSVCGEWSLNAGVSAQRGAAAYSASRC